MSTYDPRPGAATWGGSVSSDTRIWATARCLTWHEAIAHALQVNGSKPRVRWDQATKRWCVTYRSNVYLMSAAV